MLLTEKAFDEVISIVYKLVSNKRVWF